MIAQLPENSADYAYSEQETLHIEFLADPDGLKIMLDGRTLDGDVVPESSSVFAYDDEEALRMAIIKVQTAFKRMLREAIIMATSVPEKNPARAARIIASMTITTDMHALHR